ncbi:phenylacetate--CoA ligase family protein [Pseudonocardia acaciae]|uniref:phenylacetate--CoA ligase family protein n=1 Tax=Pseudonocardia acaciae TaxID=551276 RepID=UPI0004911415|nr:AMP-binding protein [Pseudonocardia acaciae]
MSMPATAEEVERAREARVGPMVANAWRSPFFRARLVEAGAREGQAVDQKTWRRIRPTTKDELRGLSAERFASEVTIARDDEIAMYWRSGGVTGRPLFYPKARRDMPALVESFTRVLRLAGVRPGELVHNSFPFLGVHPIGHMFGHALSAHGCGNVFAGSGANTPSDVQVELLMGLRPSVWMGIGSYINILGHRAEAAGHEPSSSSLRRIISSAEPLTPAKRARIERMWGGAELFDSYGMTECSMMGAECERHDGLHVWADLFLVEIVDEGTGEPLPAGEVGAVLVTPLHAGSAIPFLRWSSGDIGALEPDCECPYAMFPKLRLAARTVGFSKVRGVNVNHNDLEDALLRVDAVADYLARVVTAELDDRLLVDIEVERPGPEPGAVAARVRAAISAAFELKADVTVLERGTIARRLDGEVKPMRVRDER